MKDRTARTCPKGGKLSSHHRCVLKKSTATARGYTSMLSCGLGLALVTLEQETCCPEPLQCLRRHRGLDQTAHVRNTGSQAAQTRWKGKLKMSSRLLSLVQQQLTHAALLP